MNLHPRINLRLPAHDTRLGGDAAKAANAAMGGMGGMGDMGGKAVNAAIGAIAVKCA
jgi:hypothetical protein